MAPLHGESVGEGPTLVLAHGFTQTGRLWGRFGELVGRRRRVVSVDLPGHGASSEVAADLVSGGALLAQAGGTEPFDLLGYSLGARFALHAALVAPERIDRLILISATAGIEDADQRAARRSRDEDLAAGLQGLVMDVKVGSGAFLPDLERARELAQAIVEVAVGHGAATRRPAWLRACGWPAPAPRSHCGIGWAS